MIRFGTLFPTFFIYFAQCETEEVYSKQVATRFEDKLKAVIEQYRASEVEKETFESILKLKGNIKLHTFCFVFP
jgi:hypothetical protein